MIGVKEFEAPLPWKRPHFTVELPPSAKALSIHPPFNMALPAILLIALDDSLPTQARTFHWRPSGVDATGIGGYVGSALFGLKFLHLFEERP